MSGPMDVLKDAVTRLPKSKWDDGQRALAVMGELIESMKPLIEQADEDGCNVLQSSSDEFLRIRAAFVNAGGAK